ncbi:MAG: hypothetical protein A2W23_03455 [Planctomycetes bacterium RBG_16_43_13]|nr:MAG: hypothetical protein A2W23_03455 [Planctomycetes bacterium RBG_16_43_13]
MDKNEDTLQEILLRLSALEQRLDALELGRKKQIESAVANKQVVTPHPAPAPVPIVEKPASPQKPWTPFKPSLKSVADERRYEPIKAKAQYGVKPQDSATLEEKIGGRWLSRIGIAAVFLAVVFFMKYSFENNLISPTMRVLTGIAAGIVALTVGWILNRKEKYSVLAQSLWGGGIAILYLAIFGAFAYYHLIEQVPAFIAMIAVTATAIAIATYHNSYAVAVIGLIGGFLTPALLSTGVDNQVGLFSYIFILDIGFIAISYKKRWRSLSDIAFGATILTFLAWFNAFYDVSKIDNTMLFLSIGFLIFLASTYIHNVVGMVKLEGNSMAIFLINPFLYYVTMHWLLARKYDDYQGVFAIALCIVYELFSLAALKRMRYVSEIVKYSGGAAIVFFAVFAPAQFNGTDITLCWFVQAVLLCVLGRWLNVALFRIGAMAIWVAAVANLLFFNMPDKLVTVEPYLTVWNLRGLLFGAAIISGYLMFLIEIGNKELRNIYLLVVQLATLIFICLELNQWFDSNYVASAAEHLAMKQRWISVAVIAYAFLLVLVAVRWQMQLLYILSSLLFSLVLAKVILYDSVINYTTEARIIGNDRFITMFIVSAITFLTAIMSSKVKVPADWGVPKGLFTLAGYLLVLLMLTFEMNDYFDVRKGIYPAYIKQMCFSVLWAIYFTSVMLIGMYRKDKLLYGLSYALFSLVLIKVILFDSLINYTAETNVILNTRFITILVVTALTFLIYKISSKVAIDMPEANILKGAPVLVGHFLVLFMLSLEIKDFFDLRKEAIDVGFMKDPQYAKHMCFSALWSIYSIGLILVGIYKNSKILRYFSLTVLIFTIGKVFIHDLSFLEQVYRILSFVVLGMILLGVSYLYQRFKTELFGSTEGRK